MRTRDLFFLPLALASVFLGPSLLRAPGAGLVAEAHAQDALSACSLKGSPQLARGLQLFDSPKDGKVIAEFIGGAVPLSLTVPEDPENSRAKVSTSAGKPTLRLEGWLSMESIPVYTVKDVEVVGDHVKISAGYRVKLTKGAKTRLSAEVTIAGSQSQVLKGTGGCNAFSLAWATPNPPEPPEKARHYLMKGTSLDLFDKPNGENIYSLNMSDGASPLFHSIESRGMYMHVMSRSDVAIDAWVKLGTLTPIKKGDRIESPPSAPASGPGSRMVLDSPPPLKTASKDILVRPSREDTAKAAGVLEKGAEFYVTQVVSGWANILPKELNISPPSSGGFWVKSDDLP